MKNWKYFHVSPHDLGRSVVLYPRVPTGRYIDWDGKDIEDCVTPRVCFSTSVDLALKATSSGPYNTITRFIYAIEEIASKIDCSEIIRSGQCPNDQPDNPYNEDFWWAKYAKYHNVDFNDISFQYECLKYCVPDALTTNEFWSLEPITIYKVGVLSKGKITKSDFGILKK